MSYSFMKFSGNIEQSIKDRFIPDGACVDIQVVELRDEEYFGVAFAAVRMRQFDNRIGAITYLLKRPTENDETEWMVQEVEEYYGSPACFCPQSILDQLDPPLDWVSQAWREKCKSVGGWEHEQWAEDLLVV